MMYGIFDHWPDDNEPTTLIFHNLEAAKLYVDAVLRDGGICDYVYKPLAHAARFTRSGLHSSMAARSGATLYWILPVSADGRCDVG